MSQTKFEEFLRLPNFFYRSWGMQANGRKETQLRRMKLSPQDGEREQLKFIDALLFYLGFINLNVHLIGECTFVWLALRNDDFIGATMTLTYVGFVFLSDFKILFMWCKRRLLANFIDDLYILFPHSAQQERHYELSRYLRQCKRVTVAFVLLYMVLIWTYNMYAIVQYLIYDRWLHIREVGQNLPYTIYVPWQWQGNWSYYMLYASQCVAGYIAAAGHVAIDLLLCSTATQLIMHYDYVARTIENYRLHSVNDYSNLEFLSELVQYHEKIFKLSNIMNDIFGVPLFLNFMTSCFVICLVGFQMTIGVAMDTLFKLLLFLISSKAEVYLICYYGQELINASEGIALAVYKHDWHIADIGYKKMLILIAKRAQKPALLRATYFFPISRSTMTELLQISYKFFALLRAMYDL